MTPPRRPPAGSAWLVALSGATRGRKYMLGDDQTLGRGSEATFRFDDDRISRVHARIVRQPDGAMGLEDLRSTNGTKVNDAPVTMTTLAPGDRIQLGEHVILMFSHHDLVHEELLRRQRLETLGRLSAGIAHDLNNLLAAVVTSLEFLRAAGPRSLEEPEVVEALSDAWAAASRAAQLSPRLRSFVRPDEQAHAVVDVTATCQEVVQLIEHAVGRAVQVDSLIERDLLVHGNVVELHQMLMNLCINARDAMLQGGTLKVAAERASGEVAISVSDTGPGMDAATRAQIFEPFFTTKRGGFGLGLATVKELCAAHGGRIEVESAVGRGSTFRIVLPASTKEDSDGGAEHTKPHVLRPASCTVLVVDDIATVRRSVARALGQMGHRAVVAEGGAEAVQLYHREQPDVVLLDLDMPGMNGVETLAALLKLDGCARVLIVSGQIDGERERETRALGAHGFLQKPFSVDALELAIAEAFKERQRAMSALLGTTVRLHVPVARVARPSEPTLPRIVAPPAPSGGRKR